MGVYLFKRLRVTLESGETLILGAEKEDGLRQISSETLSEPIPFSEGTLEGSAFNIEKRKYGVTQINMCSSVPRIGQLLVLRPRNPFSIDELPEIVDMLMIRTPIAKIENF